MALTFDQHKNFAYSVVATAPSPAISGTTLIVAAGDGSAKFPTPPFNAVVWPTGVQPTTTNAEVIRVTAKATDTLTIVRAQESSSARTIVTNDQIAVNITNKALTDIEASFVTAGAITAPVGGAIMWLANAAPTGWILLDGSAISRTTFSELFALWGTFYGIGDGSTTFNIPDLRQRIPIGKAASGTLNTLGVIAGAWDHTHGPGSLQVASHSHSPGTLQVASHTHDFGTLQVATHTHGAGTLSTDNANLAHTHDMANHNHTFTTGGPSSNESVGDGADNAGSGVHTHSGTTNGPSNNTTSSALGTHSHSVNAGTTASTAPAVNSGATGAASPLVTGGSTATASPLVTGGVTGTGNPPVWVVNFIVRATSSI
jgi:microcystin-dependent protein